MTEQTGKKENPLLKANGIAIRALIEENLDRFNALKAQAASDLGVDWSPPPTEEQKAKAEIEDLFKKYPHLRESFTKEDTPSEGVTQPDGSTITES